MKSDLQINFLIKSRQIYLEDGNISAGGVVVAGQKIQDILSEKECAVLECGGAQQVVALPEELRLIPGFIDIHVHGAAGADFMDAKDETLIAVSKNFAQEGVTSFLATTMTALPRDIEQAIRCVKKYKEENDEDNDARSELLGINLEGPFIAPSMVGAQNPKYVRELDVNLLRNFIDLAEGAIKIVTVAPEPDFAGDKRGIEMLKYLKTARIISAIGHSAASFSEAQLAFAAGCDHATHLFNAMRKIENRDPGLVVAILLNDNVTAEIIADGVHVDPAVLQMALRCKGADKLILITDAIRAKGMPPGIYELGGQKVVVKDKIARLENGKLAGSVLTMPEAFCNIIKFVGCSFADAIKMASVNPAKKLGVYDRKGSIAKNKDADLIALDADYRVQFCMCRGKIKRS